MRLIEAQLEDVGAVLAVHGDAAPLGDETDDGLAGHRVAAVGHAGLQVAHAEHGDVAAAPLARGLARLGQQAVELFLIVALAEQLLGLVQHLADTQIAGPQGGVHVVRGRVVDLVGQAGEVHALDVEALHLALEQRPALLEVAVARLQLEPGLDLGPGPGGAHVAQVGIEPVAARPALAGGEDLHLLAGLEAVGEWHDAPVDLGATAAMTHLGVHPVGEVDGRGDPRQVDDVAVGGEDVDAIRRHIAGQPLAKVAEVADLLVPLEHLAQPGDLLLVAGAAGAGVMPLVAPVGAHPELGLLVHGEGADLDLQHLALRAEHRGMQRLVAVLLGVGDVVVELVGHVMPARVDDAQHRVAVAHLGHQDTHRADVVDLGEVDALALHLPPDRVDVLGAAIDLVAADALRRHQRLEGLDHLADVAVAVLAPLGQLAGDGLVVLVVQVAKGEVLELPLEVADAQPVGQRGIDVEHLAGHLLTLLPRGIAHLAQRAGALGDLDQGDAHVVDQVDQHLAQVVLLVVLGQALAGRLEGADGRHLQHAVDQPGHLATEALLDLGEIDQPLAHRPIEHRGLERRLVQLELAEDIGHLEPHAEARTIHEPGLVGAFGDLFQVLGEPTGLLHLRDVAQLDVVLQARQPQVDIDRPILGQRLILTHFNHRSALLEGRESSP